MPAKAGIADEDEIERFASDIWESWTPVVYGTHTHPRLDMYEEKDELVIRTELPGIKKEDIDVSLENGLLTIKAEKKQEEVSEDANYYSCERYFGTYSGRYHSPSPLMARRFLPPSRMACWR